MPDLVPGVLVTPAIRLVRKLGAGGMGSVWIGEHLALRTEVVVKFMSDSLGQSAADRARFSREATAASQVRSPHVVQVFDHGLTPDGTPFIVMELLEGEDLGRRIARLGRMPLPDVVELVDQLALALSRVHAARIVHRDVKPANIFVCDRGDGRPFYKLLDFGIAKGSATNMMIGSPTLTGAVVATPAYGSPEQLVGSKSVDHRSDLWSLGLVAFKALTGQLPYHGDSVASLALAIHNGPPPRLTSVVPSLPPAIDDWFARVCKVAAEDRFQSAPEMAKALAAAAANAPTPAPPMPALHGATLRDVAEPTVTSPSPMRTLPLSPPKIAIAEAYATTKASPGMEPSTEPATMAVEATWRPPGSALPRILVGVGLVGLIGVGAVLVALTRHPKAAADVSAAVPPSLSTTAAAPAPAPSAAPIPSAAPEVASAAPSAVKKPAPRPATVHARASTTTVEPPAPAPAPAPSATPTATPTNAGKLF